ncbi:type II toxin-antitoxin system RelE/ParE family toxin [Streptomyces bacillaris]|uniref:type II toxin-antitoxin system RelE/ParE family toxin n=1 Tax=Streptomyces bacillaris TaxID=68179 RepID=UPI00381A1F00
MTYLHVIEVEPEVRDWQELLPEKHYMKVEEYAGLLASMGTSAPMPFSRPLRDGVYELRPTLGGEATRITYWFASDRRIVLLTVFRKTRMRESAQVDRALQARAVCEATHGPAHSTYVRGESRETS